MKKWLLAVVVILILIIGFIYFSIPSTLDISAITIAKATRDGTFRTLTSKTEWKKWWNYTLQKNDTNNDSSFTNNNYSYNLTQAAYNNALISIQHNSNITNSKITLIEFKTDSIAIIWQCALQTSANPIQKVQQYFAAVDLKKNMETVLKNLKAFVENNENIYGIKIYKGTVRDSSLISTKKMFNQQPTMNDVYTMISDLKNYATKNNCIQTDPPMLNILHDSDKYRVMVALPINKITTVQEPISFIQMTRGNFMITKVQGGLATVQNALQQMQLYFDDYNKTPMAITFQYLVTDRIKETDTTKWVTEIYAPVLE